MLEHSFSQTRHVDPRFIEFQRSIAAENVQANRGIIQELKDMLSQLGMELNIEDDSKGAVEITTVVEKVQTEDAKIVTIREGRRFGIAEEPYRIKPGDSLYTIARRYKVSVKDLRRWNKLSDRYLQPGQRLKIYLRNPVTTAL